VAAEGSREQIVEDNPTVAAGHSRDIPSVEPRIPSAACIPVAGAAVVAAAAAAAAAPQSAQAE